ncbi:hypothetical protein SS50377_23404 [Spironucleus salmonicida]|uniref:Uncharacterized protein n=1 Tax=Spironucleus salmonicida TaxID=348837 RepID=V6LRS7_9EUKA|nr:hypothetical protein SS50377_23404 [Spironucleus salmonicida]|eukprot:EST47275.1 Hypothetical protein SS50377_12785 [Spironucleus salmonicida]
MSSNQFAALSEDFGKVQPEQGKPRDSKRHEPHKPAQGRQFDRNSVKGESRGPRKEGNGPRGAGNPKDSRVREETEEQKQRREARETESREAMENHSKFIETIKELEVEVIVADAKAEVIKNHEMPADIVSLGKKAVDSKQKKQKSKQIVMFE